MTDLDRLRWKGRGEISDRLMGVGLTLLIKEETVRRLKQVRETYYGHETINIKT